MSDMAGGPVVELSITAREVDLLSRVLERQVSEVAAEWALDVLSALAGVVPEHMPAYVHASMARGPRTHQGRVRLGLKMWDAQ